MAAGTLISLEEYLSNVYEPDCEYLDGELVERNMGESDHSALQGMIFAWLYNRRHEAGIHVFPELRVQVTLTRFRIPDICVTTQKVRGKILHEPPFLCIEVLSPEDRAGRIQRKIDDYLAFGVRYVWLIDPGQRRAWSYTIEGKRESPETLTTSDPDLTLSLRDIFEALSEDLE
jgi:Uma2 family endonuclease